MSKTVQMYYDAPYLTELKSQVTGMQIKGAQCLVELAATIFYPQGGGHPCDQGEIAGPEGKLQVGQVRAVGDQILHQGKVIGKLNVGDEVRETLKWNPRHKNMRVHSAGHLLHDVLMSMADGLTPTKGNHGQKAFLEYNGQLDPALKDTLQDQVNQVLAKDLPIVTRNATVEEIQERCRFVPPMPDGGVQVKSTKEIGSVVIHNIASENNAVVIRYGIKG